MGMQSGFYNVEQEGVYVSENNEIVWEYKVVKKDFEEQLFLLARDFITGRRVSDYRINSIDGIRDALEFLSKGNK